MIARLEDALLDLVVQLRQIDGLAGVVLFGSYARGEQGLKSDVDLLILFRGSGQPETSEAGRAALRIVGAVETAHRLPMHLAPLLAGAERPRDLGNDLLHTLWAEGIVLYAEAGALAQLRPEELSPYAIIRFSLAGARPAEKVRLSRRLHGQKGIGAALGAGAHVLGPGVLLLPAAQTARIRTLLDEAGAVYDVIQVWR